MELRDFMPALNASLNSVSAVLLALGFVFIRRGRVLAHRRCMISAFIVSTLFLISYLTYHALFGSRRFPNPHPFRGFYLALLTSHTVLAVVIVPLILVTLSRALRQRFDLHKKIARWTWPLWMYVSVTGVLVYLMLYKWFPAK